MSLVSKSLLLFGFIQSAVASFACTPNNAVLVEPAANVDGNAGDSAGGSDAIALSLSGRLNEITKLAGDSIRNAAKRSDRTSSARLPSLKERQEFACSDTSECFVENAGLLICADSTGEYTTASGICGNTISGAIDTCGAAGGDAPVVSGSGGTGPSPIQDGGIGLSSVGTSCHAAGTVVTYITMMGLLGKDFL